MMFGNIRDNHSTWESRSLSLNCLKMMLIKYLCGQIIKKKKEKSTELVERCRMNNFFLIKKKTLWWLWIRRFRVLVGSKMMIVYLCKKFWQVVPASTKVCQHMVSLRWHICQLSWFSWETPCFLSPSSGFPLGSQISSVISHVFPFSFVSGTVQRAVCCIVVLVLLTESEADRETEGRKLM